MAKKSSFKKTKNSKIKSRHKSVGYYIKIYSISFFVAAIVYVIGGSVFKPPPPCANSLTCQSDLAEKIENGAVGSFQGKKVVAPPINLSLETARSSVLGANVPNDQKHIYVDLSAQTLYAYQGSIKIMQTLISSGRWGKTPVGNFNIWEKLRATRMSGGSGDDAYDLPNVPFVMYFYHDFGLHGAYWHDNFGHTMSHGCVNMRQIDAQALFDWTDGPSGGNLGTPVSICNHFTPPNNCLQEDPIS